jgi:hypothetical protein
MEERSIRKHFTSIWEHPKKFSLRFRFIILRLSFSLTHHVDFFVEIKRVPGWNKVYIYASEQSARYETFVVAKANCEIQCKQHLIINTFSTWIFWLAYKTIDVTIFSNLCTLELFWVNWRLSELRDLSGTDVAIVISNQYYFIFASLTNDRQSAFKD